MMVFAFVDDKDIAGFDGVIDAVDRQNSAALDENEDFVDIVDVASFGVGGLAGLEYIYAPVCDLRITEVLRHELQAIGFQVGDSKLSHRAHPFVGAWWSVLTEFADRFEHGGDVGDGG